MYLKSLELQGFKSFPDKTTLYFDNGATVIVGPNGSGKSNITDAMRWVLGELSSKNIRGSKMEDVIFIGTEVRKPMSYAEVSVTFDNSSEEGRLNSPYDTITVTRRYFRAGESQYLINKSPVRLKDIYELFMNTGVGREGYSIIGQGRIAEIISKKSEDRRNIFEEAAGISKYRYKKEESERKLKQTQDNMDRVNDIFAELQARVGPLERDAEKAKKYYELYDKKKVADVSLWIYDSQKIQENINKNGNEYKMLEHELDLSQATLDEIDNQDNSIYEKLQQIKLDSEKIYAEIKSCNTTIATLDSDLKVMQNNVEHAKISSGAQIEEMEKLSAKKEVCLNDIKMKEDACDRVKNDLETSNQHHEELNKKQKNLKEKRDEIVSTLEELLVKQQEFESMRDDCNLKISLIENSNSNDSERHSEIKNDIAKYKSELEDLTSKAEALMSVLAKYENSLREFEKSISDKNEEIDKKTVIYDDLKEKMDILKSSSLALFERINALRNMEELFEGYQKSVTYIMNAYKNNEISDAGTIYGPVSTLINVPNEYVTAVETALGTGLQHIVVDNEKTAKACIYTLKNNKVGRATFYPITSVSPQSQTAEMQNVRKNKGYIGIANELISFDKKFDNIFSSLLGRTLIFDNIENATNAANSQNYRIKIVTLDGQQINVGGSFTGGSVKHDGSVLSRTNNIKNMEAEKEETDKQISEIKLKGQKLSEELRDLVSKRGSDKQQYDITDTLYRTEKTEYETLSAQINVKKELIEGLILDTKRINDENEKSVAELANYRNNYENAVKSIEDISAQRLELDVKKYEFEEEIENVSGEINRNLIKIAEISKDIESSALTLVESQNRLREIEEDIEKMKSKMDSLNEQVSSSAEKTAENRALYDSAVKRLESLEAERTKLSDTETEYEKKRNNLSAKKKDIMAKRENMVRSHTMTKGKYEQLNSDFEKMVNKLYEDYGLTYSTAVELGYPEVDEKNRKEILNIANECKQKIRSLGSVNPNAIEEYKEVKERYDYYNTQLTDLEKSKKDLLKIISDLEVEMKKNFVEAFNAINENFDIVFKELFGGGHAELSLTDENDVLNCGIEIKAAPPGKVIKSLMLLSGGEQAIVAIALLFAILRVNPTPFCIFDEIEAALDDVNVARFGQYIKKYSNQTQFIVITHRRGTMEIADRLYGVTMPQKGISRVLTMNVNDVGKDRILENNNAN